MRRRDQLFRVGAGRLLEAHAHWFLGPQLRDFAAYLLLRGMKTLQLRVERQNSNALAVARHLADARVLLSDSA